ncbi:MAG: glycosyltransferase family 2 protein [Phycisphaerales bacterium]|nr:glycosyltransferase family 2 protein [Phycisphaerales bacterium]
MRTLVAIPVFNEAPSVQRVIRAVRRYTNDLLVIDDGSTDDTPHLLRRTGGISVLTHPENRGYGQSLIDAFRFAGCRGFDWVVTLDCDDQHEPAQLPDFFRAIRDDDADVISGSRYLRSDPRDDAAPADRREINRLLTGVMNTVLRLDLTDSFCGFKAHRVAAMQSLSLDEPGYAFPMQFWVQCARENLRIRELPVRRIYRDASRSFPGTLDDPGARLTHYLDVLIRALHREPLIRHAAPCDAPCPPCTDA